MATDFTDHDPEKPIEDILDDARAEASDVPADLPTEANSADVVDQSIEVPIDDEDR